MARITAPRTALIERRVLTSGTASIAPLSNDRDARARREIRRARMSLIYAWRHGRMLSWDDPQTFTELVQHSKLNDRDPAMPRLADKVAVKADVAARLGSEWVIPTLFTGVALPGEPQWDQPFVVKSRHGCRQNAFVRQEIGRSAWDAIRARADRWVATTYGEWLDEWLYSQIPRGILVEPFVGEQGRLPIDYKLYVFAGRVDFVQVHLDREHRHRWVVLDRKGRAMAGARTPDVPALPASIDAMIAAAEVLGRDLPFVRADFYEIGGVPKFGELTFYPGSGLDPFDPRWLDAEMGRRWRAARGTVTIAAPPAPGGFDLPRPALSV